MAELVVRIPDITYTPVLVSKWSIRTEDGAYDFRPPFGPRDVTFDNRLYDWNAVSRPGRRDLQLRSSPQSPTMSFNLVLGPKRVGNMMAYSDQTDNLKLLQNIMSSSKRIVIYGVKWLSDGYWRGTKMSINTEQLNPDLTVKSCTVSCEFIMAEDYVAAKGPTTGGVQSATTTPAVTQTTATLSKVAAASTPVSGKPSVSTRTYQVKKGDTLSMLACRYYNNSAAWRRIADRNKIKKPWKLKPGQTLIIP